MTWDQTKITTFEQLKQAKAKFYAADAPFRQLQSKLHAAPPSDRAAIGKQMAALKAQAEQFFQTVANQLEQQAIAAQVEQEWVDISYPLTPPAALHPLTLITKRLETFLQAHGFVQVYGSEIEQDEYNFTKLNIPADHPARQMHDSLYIDKATLLRTHNTGFSVRGLEAHQNQDFAQFVIGPVYRNDEDDATHSHQFTQLDLIAVSDHFTFGNLIYFLRKLLSYVLEEQVKIRLRPSYFPFTEPSVEVDVFYRDQWMEILGAGMVHKRVLEMAGYTVAKQAFAAGIGVERLAMMKYGISDIREFYKNDLRFLQQFQEGE